MLKENIKKLMAVLGFEYKYGKFRKRERGRIKNPYHKKILSEKEANDLIKNKIVDDSPFLVSRIGSVELTIIIHYIHFKKGTWKNNMRNEICFNAGVFPTDDDTLDKFSIEYLDSIKEVDVMGVWYNNGENEIIEKQCPTADLIPLKSIEPYFFEDPWSEYLAGQKVLVIHPFEESIQLQYLNNRENLFENKKVLPSFELMTLKAIQTHMHHKSPYGSWFQALDEMKKTISTIDFDVAIIGAGAYGLPLGAFIKKLGKKAIHMGGATQILFGIKGKRWEERDNFKSLFNSYWKNPSAMETPVNAEKLEGGCYW